MSAGKKVQWAMAGGEPTAFVTGTGVGKHTEDRVPLVIARRQLTSTAYLWCVALGATEAPEISAEEIKLPDGRRPPTSHIAAARVKTADGTCVVLANPGGVKVLVADQPVEAKIAWLEAIGTGKLKVKQLVR